MAHAMHALDWERLAERSLTRDAYQLHTDCGCGGADHDDCALANSYTVTRDAYACRQTDACLCPECYVRKFHTIPDALFPEARGWIADAFGYPVRQLSDAQVAVVISHEYAGGIAQFIADTATLLN